MELKNSAIALLFLVGCCSNSCSGRILSQCEFIEEFQKYSTQISQDNLNKWTCIVHHQSNFNSAQKTVGADGTTFYGLFQLSDRYVCSQKADGERVCKMPCSKFEDDHLGDDFECALKIYADRLKSGPGFGAWPIYFANCTNPEDYVEECRRNATQSITNVGKIYDRCELARELFDVHKFPMDQISTWVCIASHVSLFNTSAVSAVDADGGRHYGLFQISDTYWCNTNGTAKGCNIPCSQLTDSNITDDAVCLTQIFREYGKMQREESGNGFSAWTAYETDCKDQASTSVRDCFDEAYAITSEIDLKSSQAPRNQQKSDKIYDRCELAQELYTIYKFPMDQISTWICIVEHESNYNTSAVGALNRDGSRDHGLFQISDIYWCSIDDVPKVCNIPCSKLEDSDISDDVECVKRVFEQHQNQFSDGFHAWTTYAESCYNQTSSYVAGCFDDENAIETSEPPSVPTQSESIIRRRRSVGKVFKRCELARELRTTHNFPMDEIHLWICIVQHVSNYNTSFIGDVNMDGSYNHGLFQLSDKYWCSSDGTPKKCGVPCSKFEDADITDDVNCVKQLFEENQRLYSDGFQAWIAYIEPCQDRTAALRYIDGCFDDKSVIQMRPLPTTSMKPRVSSLPSKLSLDRSGNGGKVFGRCELAQELRTTYNFPMDEIHTWLCIVQHVSNYNTSFIGNVNMDGSYNHGLFQLSDRYWCSSDGNPKGCGVPCSKFEDADISDDVECARRLFEVNRKQFSDGFHAWVEYIEPCQDRKATLRYIDGCFNDNNNFQMSTKAPSSGLGNVHQEQTTQCGTRGVPHQGLITNGVAAKDGDWPWHSAIYHISKDYSQDYKCGGSLISATAVLTAAHCLYDGNNEIIPERVVVIIGKYDLAVSGENTKQFLAYRIFVHEKYDASNLLDDIGLIRLGTVVTFTAYVRPICLWDPNQASLSEVVNQMGIVVGWGLTERKTLSRLLKQTFLPIVSHATCLASDRAFFSLYISEKTFCAGFKNGTTPCLGDSGGGLYIKNADGAYRLRGIVSVSKATNAEDAFCDSKQYVVFTDAAQYLDWINERLSS